MKFLAIIATLLFSAAPAFADLYLEPYVGYETGKYKSGTTSTDVKGSDLGVKLGYSTLGFAFGADYMMGSLEDDSTPSSKADTKDLGAFAQYTFPILIKVSLTYFLDSKSETNNTEIKGGGTKLGVGYTGLPFVSINLDMININYDDPSPINVDRESYLLSLSLPLNL